jgi:4-hydroxybenzoyl-CoA thioesterase
MGFGEIDERGDDGIQIGFDYVNRRAQLENQSGIECVLAGGAVVHIAQCIGGAATHDRIELFQERNGEITGCGHGLRKGRQIKKLDPAGRTDCFCSSGRDYSAASLSPRQSCFEIKHGLDRSRIAEKRFDRGRVEEAVQKVHAKSVNGNCGQEKRIPQMDGDTVDSTGPSGRAANMKSNRKEIHVEWGDCDPAGIVYYPRFFEYFDACTNALFESVGFRKAEMLKTYGLLGIPMVDTRAQFYAPASFGEIVLVETRIVEWGRSSFQVEHKLYNREVLAAECSEKRVWTVRDSQARNGMRGSAIPEEVKARFE